MKLLLMFATLLFAHVGVLPNAVLAQADDEAIKRVLLAETDRFFARDSLDKPRRLAPDTFRLVVVSDAVFDAMAAEDQQVAEDLMTAIVDAPWKQHRARVVRRQDGEVLPQQRRQGRGILDRIALERYPQ